MAGGDWGYGREDFGSLGYYWSSTEGRLDSYGVYRAYYLSFSGLGGSVGGNGDSARSCGFSVRCLKN